MHRVGYSFPFRVVTPAAHSCPGTERGSSTVNAEARMVAAFEPESERAAKACDVSALLIWLGIAVVIDKFQERDSAADCFFKGTQSLWPGISGATDQPYGADGLA